MKPPTLKSPSLAVRDVRKSYGTLPALRGVSFTLEPGTTALLGRNGAGKSTLLRILATLAAPDGGSIAFAGHSYSGDLRPLRAAIGYLPSDLDLPATLTPRRVLRYLAAVRGLQEPADAADRALAAVGLADKANTRLAQLSGGQVWLVGAAQALMTRPRLLLLDEPSRGLAPDERLRFWRAVNRAGPAITLFSTHIAADVESRAEHVLVLDEGRICFHGTLDDLRARAAGQVYEVRVPSAGVEAVQRAHNVTGVGRASGDGLNTLRILGTPPREYPAESVAPALEDGYLLVIAGRSVSAGA